MLAFLRASTRHPGLPTAVLDVGSFDRQSFGSCI